MRSNVSEVGLEDSLSIRSGERGKSDAEKVSLTREFLEPLRFEIATPLESHPTLRPTGRNKLSIPQWSTA
jgi:uncharacterized protein (DUF849 family)